MTGTDGLDWRSFPLTAVEGPTFRLIPTRFPPIPAFEGVATPDDLEAVMELEGWTNDRLVRERAARIPPEERAYGRANASVVMASFLHAHPSGGRFNGSDLGAWYASTAEETALAEIASGLRREARRAGFAEFGGTYRTYRARLTGRRFTDLRGQGERAAALLAPGSWQAAQLFGEQVRAAGGSGVAFPSVRFQGGENAAAYRPTEVREVTAGSVFRLCVPLSGRITAERLS